MTTSRTTQSTRPDAHPAKNVRRAGAPNHLQGSGETLMVGNDPALCTAQRDPLTQRVFVTIFQQSHRFLSVDNCGQFTVSLDQLAVLVAEIVTGYTDQVTAERDALAEDLAWELNATRGTAGGDA